MNQISWDELPRINSEALVLLIGDEAQLDGFVGLSPDGTDARIIRGRNCRTEDDLLREWAAVLQFPYYFGNNWDALEECLSDLEWIRPDHLVVFIASVEQVLDDDDAMFQAPFLDIVLKSGKQGHERGHRAPHLVQFVFHAENGEAGLTKMGAAPLAVSAFSLP